MEDIDIARQAKLQNIAKVAEKLGIEENYLEQYGKYKAKISNELYEKLKDKKDGKLILVTSINPTPLGEGKTTISIGLADGLSKINKKAILALREPSLGPVFGIKGGATGGGYVQVAPMEEINLHFTGDIHAITSANNLLSATKSWRDVPLCIASQPRHPHRQNQNFHVHRPVDILYSIPVPALRVPRR